MTGSERKSFRLARTRQCKHCPWKVSTDPFDIPHGYDPEKHAALRNTIAEPGALNVGGDLRLMACHEHPVGQEVPCIGWLMHQLGPGNNIGLRIWATRCTNIRDVVLDGEQHPRFEDTLPPRGERLPPVRHARDCAYVTSDGPAPCTCDYYDREAAAIARLRGTQSRRAGP